MAGHSKWSKIKRKKAENDVKTGKLFTRLLKEIQVASRIGGGSPDGNPRLKTAIQTARSQSVPLDNIERAIKRGTGELEGVDYEEITYEAYGPGGIALIIKTLTDNKNRTVAELRHALSKYEGSLAGSNAVLYQFSEKGIVRVPKERVSEEQIFDIALEAGAEDVSDETDIWEITTAATDLEQVRQAVEDLGEGIEAGLEWVPENLITLESGDKLLRLLEVLDDLDDVQNIFTNADMNEDEGSL